MITKGQPQNRDGRFFSDDDIRPEKPVSKTYSVGVVESTKKTTKCKAWLYHPCPGFNTVYEFDAEDDAKAYEWLAAKILPGDERPVCRADNLKMYLKGE